MQALARFFALVVAMLFVTLSGCSTLGIQCGADFAAVVAEVQAQESTLAFAESKAAADVILRLTLRVQGENPKEVLVALRRKPSGEKAVPIQSKVEVHLGSGFAAIEAQALYVSLTSFWGGPNLHGSNTLNFRVP
ncbi:MAG: hypothetical protein JNL39_22630, partial [Opitutaceae bacterium]|nr:hypothetical protein [Opitutaceae bacterium]